MEAVDVSEANKNKSFVSVTNSDNLSSVTNSLLAGVEEVICKNINWSEEEKQRCLTRFKEIYEASLRDNVLVDGKSVKEQTGNSSNQSATVSEAEPFAKSNRKLINEEVLPQVDAALLGVTQRRKTVPIKVVQLLARRCKYECQRVRRRRAGVVNSSLGSAPSTSDDVSTEQLKGTMGTVASALSKHIVELPAAVEEAEHLDKATKMFEAHCNTQTDRALFSPLAEEERIASSLTPLRQRQQKKNKSMSPRKQPERQIDLVRKKSLRKRPSSITR